MPARLRYVEEWSTHEITTRTFQGRLLLRPSRRLNLIVAGVVAYAQRLYPAVRLHGMFIHTTHYNLIVSVPNAVVLSRFVGFINKHISEEVGRLHHWRGKFWSRPFTAIAIVDGASQIARMKYLLSQACKDRMVARLEQWPGLHCGGALSMGRPQRGIWVDRSRAYRMRAKGKKISNREVEVELFVEYTPLPVWGHLSQENYQKAIGDLIRQVEREAQEVPGKFMGADKILRQSPHRRALGLVRSPRPLCHAATRGSWQRFKRAYYAFVRAYREVFSPGWLPADLQRLPVMCFPPRSYVPAAA